jgi:CHAT domain-containing protein/Tfp pilus assembly protein PilF
MPAPAGERLTLRPGSSLDRDIRGGETKAFDLKLADGTFVLLEISQRGLDLSSRLLDSDGDEVAAGEGTGELSSQLLAMIADGEGSCRLEVVGRGPRHRSSRFTLKVRALRLAAEGDGVRVRAARRLMEARRVAAVGKDKDVVPRAMALAAASLHDWKQAGDVRGEVESLGEIARLRSRAGQGEEALAEYQKAFDRSRQSGLAELKARALSDMASCSSELGRNGTAIEWYRQSLEIWRRVGGPYEQAAILNDLAKAYLDNNNLELAVETFQEALPLALSSGDLAKHASVTNGLGAALYQIGRYDEAFAVLERAIKLSREASEVEVETAIEHNLGAIYQTWGQLQKAVEMYTHVIGRVPPEDKGHVYSSLGALYLDLGDLDKALASYQQSREAYHDLNDPQEVDALVGIGTTRQRMKDFQGALAEYERARKLSPEESWSVINHLGMVQLDLGKPQEGLRLLERARELARSSGDPQKMASTLLALGSACRALKQPEAAAEHYGKAIALGDQLLYRDAVAVGLQRRAVLREEQGRLAEARSDIEKALEVIEATRKNVIGDQIRTTFFASKRSFYDLYIDVLMQLDQRNPSERYRAQALAASERARARGLLDLLAEGRIDLSQGLDPDLRQQEAQLASKLSGVQLELRNKPSPGRALELQGEVDRLNRQQEQLDWEIRRRNPRYAQVSYPLPLKLGEIQGKLLDDRTALLEYALGPERSTLFVITREALSTYELPPAAEIAKQVERLRGALEKESNLTRPEYLESAFQLYQDLLAPAAAALATKSELLIAPDRSLYYIPFEALLTEPAGDRSYRDLPYFLRRHSITYIPSASVLAGLRGPREEPAEADRKQLVSFAPFTGSVGDRSFLPLPASLGEVKAIAGLYPSSSLTLVAGQADEETVKHLPAVAKSHRLHFATHATIDERHPEYSALILAAHGGDGYLQAHEIFNLKLSADLAVLSACQTARGKEVTGEGLVGLTRAFFYAGVPSLVVSLWNVVDGSTSGFMLDFYRGLDRGHGKATALRDAKLVMIQRGTYAHPTYWAPFILIGEPR